MRIAFFGESFVNGAGDPECLGWTGRVCAEMARAGHDITYYNLGIRGETSGRLRQRWRAEAALRLFPEHDPGLVFCYGVNDTFVEGDFAVVTVPESLNNTQAILTEARALAPLLMVGPPPIADDARNQRIGALSAAFAELCAALDVPYLAVFDALLGSPAWMAEVAAGDGAHPGAAGYTAFAALVSAWPAWRDWFTSPD